MRTVVVELSVKRFMEICDTHNERWSPADLIPSSLVPKDEYSEGQDQNYVMDVPKPLNHIAATILGYI